MSASSRTAMSSPQAATARCCSSRPAFDLPIQPAKGYSITFENANARVGLQRPIIDHHLHAVIVPFEDGSLRAAGTAEFAGYDRTLSEARVRNLIALMQDILAAGPLGCLRGQTVVRAAAFLAGWRCHHRSDSDRQPLDQQRPRPSRLDAGGRLGATVHGPVVRRRAGNRPETLRARARVLNDDLGDQ